MLHGEQEMPPGGEPAGADRNPFRLRTLVVVFMAESLALGLLQWPLNLGFDEFAVNDQGANFRVQKLLDRGLIPTVDFGYQYGLLPLLIGRGWFALLGRTPAAYAAAMLVFDLLIAWGLARCAYALRAGPVGIALILVTMLGTTLGSYINLAHACEATLICHALAEHASGRRPRALALLTACLFMKPVMAYLYGFLIVLLIVRRDGILGLARSATAAAATGVLISAGLVAWFGLAPVVVSLLPARGAESYKLQNYGFFFGVGRWFWRPPGVTPRHYLFSPAGHYLVGSVFLVAAGIASISRLARAPAARDDVNAEVIACCGIMHLSFVTMFYGAFMSWTYYYDILIIGLVAVAARGRRAAIWVAFLAVAALAGYKDWGRNIEHHWRNTMPSSETFGLWTDADCREEWRQVRLIIGDKTCSVLNLQGGCLEMFVPQFAEPEDFFLNAGYPTAAELRRKLEQVTHSEFVLIPKHGRRSVLAVWPEFRQALEGSERTWSGNRFLVYRRPLPSASHFTEPKAESARPGPSQPSATVK